MAYGHNQTTQNREAWKVKGPVITIDLNNRQRVDLNPQDFDRLLAQKGVIAKVYRTTYCPNVKSVDGAEHEIDCTLCNGSGWYDSDPICIPVLIQAQELDKLPQIEGFVDGNTVMMTFPIGVEVQYFTKIELHDHTNVYPQRVLRKPGSLIDILKYPACRVNVLVDRSGKRYFQDMDFRLDQNGNVLWLTPGDIQLVSFSADPDAGSFQLVWNGNPPSAAINWNDDQPTVQGKVRAIPGLAAATVAFVSGSIQITMVGVDTPVALFTTTANSLTHASAPVTIMVQDKSVAAVKPNDNTPYSIHYEAKTVYRCAAAIHANRFTQFTTGNQIENIKMPEQWYAKKEFLIRRRDKFDNSDLRQGPFDNASIVVEPEPDDSTA